MGPDVVPRFGPGYPGHHAVLVRGAGDRGSVGGSLCGAEPMVVQLHVAVDVVDLVPDRTILGPDHMEKTVGVHGDNVHEPVVTDGRCLGEVGQDDTGLDLASQ